MIIDHERKFMFVHVPKTGGQSICAALGGKTGGIATHAPLYAYDNPDYFRFGFIRNPWDRMVSLYHFLCQKPLRNTDNFRQAEVRAAGFKRWLMEHAFYMQEDYLPNGECWVVGGNDTQVLPPMQRRSQMFWLDGCDYVGCFESLAEDFQTICQTANIESNPLPHMNKTDHRHYQEYYDDESRDFVDCHFKKDIMLGGYLF